MHISFSIMVYIFTPKITLFPWIMIQTGFFLIFANNKIPIPLKKKYIYINVHIHVKENIYMYTKIQALCTHL